MTLFQRLRHHLQESLEASPLTRALLHDPRFVIMTAVLLLAGAVVTLGLCKIWRTTPKGVLPVVKVSVVDLFQAASLRKTALQAAAKGHADETLGAWVAASANNRGDLDLLRGMVRAATNPPASGRFRGTVVEGGLWLLKLGRTNESDLGLVVSVLEAARMPGLINRLLEEAPRPLPPGLEAPWLRCLFDLGEIGKFRRAWDAAPASVKSDEAASLQEAVIRAGWENPAAAPAVFRQLAAASPALASTTLPLTLILAERRNNLPEAERAIQELWRMRAATLRDNLAWWRILAGGGRAAEAAWWALANETIPENPPETTELMRSTLELGHPEAGVVLAENRWGENADFEPFWLVYCDLLTSTRAWDRLAECAYRIRQIPTIKDRLAGFAEYLEARSHHESANSASAEVHFAKIEAANMAEPQVAIQVASNLAGLGRWKDAARVLKGIPPGESFAKAGLALSLRCALREKDSEWLLAASKEAIKRNSEDPEIKLLFIASSVIERTNAAEALRLGFGLLQERPRSKSAAMNQAAALLLNGRFSEGVALLKKVDPEFLAPEIRSSYFFDLADGCIGLGDTESARKLLPKIDENHLFPKQRIRLNRWKSSM